LTFSERAALSRLDRVGPATAADVARLEQIRPQTMGATIAALERRGLVERGRDPTDGRRVLVSVTAAGRRMLRARRSARAEQLARALEAEFTREELRRLEACIPLLERLAERL
jgi:DNA-binding MarR family transcriptional regulator